MPTLFMTSREFLVTSQETFSKEFLSPLEMHRYGGGC
ncbi:hypothetical protein FB556_0601 [Enteractinococcus coprophilus]|uniref:Uncharacterized protein n=1 Tax=Enteractinococcus coprophilus TaxID=1027633 RepID=A0A543ANK1_9MICC|nr:hypothetical protein FB556_0601 [Enteractinococcus coprophilus]